MIGVTDELPGRGNSEDVQSYMQKMRQQLKDQGIDIDLD